MKFISRSAYAFALVIPFINLVGETKASKILSSENQLFYEITNPEDFKFTHHFKENKFNLDFEDILIAEDRNQKYDKEINQEKKVLISEIIIEGLEDHPDKERLEIVAYDSMLIRPGSKVSSEEVKKDLDRIYSSGWFSGARIESLQRASGVQLLIKLESNPILNKIAILPLNTKLTNTKIDEIFNND